MLCIGLYTQPLPMHCGFKSARVTVFYGGEGNGRAGEGALLFSVMEERGWLHRQHVRLSHTSSTHTQNALQCHIKGEGQSSSAAHRQGASQPLALPKPPCAETWLADMCQIFTYFPDERPLEGCNVYNTHDSFFLCCVVQ